MKMLFLRGDERVLFVYRRYAEKKISFESLCHELNTSIILTESKAIFDSIYITCTLTQGKEMSHSERIDKKLKSTSLTYGEIEYDAFYHILRKLPIANCSNGTFYDLGSGTGRAVVAAYLNCGFRRHVGIELLENLYVASMNVLQEFQQSNVKKLLLGCNSSVDQCKSIEYHCKDICQYDWSDGDVVFANSTCFNSELMMSISAMAKLLKPGAIVVTFTKPLDSERSDSSFDLLEKVKFKMSWGPATVYIQQRRYKETVDSSPVSVLGDWHNHIRACEEECQE